MTHLHGNFLYPRKDYERWVELFHRIFGKHDPIVVLNLADRVNVARDQFFASISDLPYGVEDVDPGEDATIELWILFEAWVGSVRLTMEDRQYVWLDPERATELWEQFRNLVPTIYVAVIQACLADPAKLNYVGPEPNIWYGEGETPQTVTLPDE